MSSPKLSIILSEVGDGDRDGRESLYRAQPAFAQCEIVRVSAANRCASRNAGLERAVGEFVLFDDGAWSPGVSDVGTMIAAGTAGVDVVRCETAAGPGANLSFGPGRAAVVGTIFRRELLARHELRFAECDGARPVLAELTLGAPALLLARGVRIVASASAPAGVSQRVLAELDECSRDAEAYEQHLVLLTDLGRLRNRIDAGRESGLDAMMMRIAVRFAVHAPTVLPAARLRPLFDRSVELFGRLSPGAVLAVSKDIRNRLPFVAFCAGDFELYRAGAVDPSRVVVDGKRLRLDLGLGPQWHAALTAQRPDCYLDGVRVDVQRRLLVISGNVHLPGIDLSGPHSVKIGVRLRGSDGVENHGAVIEARREISVIRPKELYSAFHRAIPTKRLGNGTYSVGIVVQFGDERIVQAALPTSGYLKSARDLRTGRCHVVAKTTDGGLCQLLIGTGSARQWRRTLRAEDVRHIRDRGPLWRERLLRLLTRPRYRGRRVWLLGERPDTAQDNAAVLFRYLRENHREIDAYYVIDQDSPQRERLAGLDNVVAHSSRRHALLMLHATVLINAYDVDYFMLPRTWDREEYVRHLAWRVGARRAYLQHGVTYNDVGPALNRGNKGFDLLLAVSEREAAYLRERTRYDAEVQALGFPRFDRLRARTAPTGRILFMPTWRRYLVAPSYDPTRTVQQSFTGSDYERFLKGFLNSPTLRAELERCDAVLEVIPHYEVASRADELFAPSDRVVFAHGREIQAAINDCDLLITDWSSVFFDAAYRGVPVITAPFDEAAFRAGHYAAGYFDMDRDGLGPVATTVEELIARTVHYMDNGYVREPEYERRSAEFFAHRDSGNCRRVTDALMKLG